MLVASTGAVMEQRTDTRLEGVEMKVAQEGDKHGLSQFHAIAVY
jgi:hypothetical protein